MSYIDCFKHELLGYFNGLPIYHPLEKIIGDGWGQYDFSATPENLILGGGSGEHPALVLHNLPALVAQYLLLAIENTENNFPEYKISISSKIIDAVTDIYYTKSELEFCAWSMVDMHEFVNNAKSPLHSTPFQSDANCRNVEGWIEYSIGEFIYYSLPDLLPDDSNRLFDEYRKWHMGYWMRNIVCPPPNYIKTRKESLSAKYWQEVGYFGWNYIRS
ncbi:MAG: hypothetical protein AB2990_01470 [Candidatus Symbiodolus clandestinus]